jgi:hypothetical protein
MDGGDDMMGNEIRYGTGSLARSERVCFIYLFTYFWEVPTPLPYSSLLPVSYRGGTPSPTISSQLAS